jgi:hypothetical protein
MCQREEERKDLGQKSHKFGREVINHTPRHADTAADEQPIG